MRENILIYTHLFFLVLFSKKWAYFLDKNLFSWYLLNLTFYNHRYLISDNKNLEQKAVIF